MSEFDIYEQRFMLNYADFLESLVIKSAYDAEHAFGESDNVKEAAEISKHVKDSESAGELYTLAMFKQDTIFNYIVSESALKELFLPAESIRLFKTDKQSFFRSMDAVTLDKLLEYYRNKTITEYEEKNPYYLALNGEPKDESEYVFIEDIYDGGYYPIHAFSKSFHYRMYAYLLYDNSKELNLIIEKERKEGRDYEYFNYLSRKTPYHIARNAKNFELLYTEAQFINTADRHLFYDAYKEARLYVLEVPYIPSYSKTEVLYDRFMGVSVLFLASLRFLSKRMTNYLRNVYPSRSEKKLFLAQYRLDNLVDIIDDDIILNEIIDHVDELIAIKGTDEVITRILKLFGNYDIDIYKYLLFKSANCDSITKELLVSPNKNRNDNYNISLVKVPINVVSESRSLASYISNKQSHTSLESAALSDKYFGELSTQQTDNLHDPKRDFIKYVENMLKTNEQFSMFYTKYVGVITHIDAIKNMIQSVYLFTTAIMNDIETMNTHVNSNGFLQEVTIRDLLAAINYLAFARYNITDEIITDPAHISQFIGFNPDPDLNDLKQMSEYVIATNNTGDDWTVKLPDLIKEEDIFIVINSSTSGTAPLEFQKEKPVMTAYYYNLTKHDELLKKMELASTYDEWLGLKQVFNYNMYSKVIFETFGNAGTYTAYLTDRDNGLLEYMRDYINARTESVWYNDDGGTTELFKLAASNLISRFLNLILETINSDMQTNSAVISTYIDPTTIFAKIMNVIELFKHYTISFTTSEAISVINNPSDCFIKLFDMVGKNEGLSDTRDTITLYLFDWAANFGNSKLGTKSVVKDGITEKSDGAGDTVISIQNAVSEKAKLTEYHAFDIRDDAGKEGVDRPNDNIVIDDTDVKEDAYDKQYVPVQIRHNITETPSDKELLTLNIWDIIRKYNGSAKQAGDILISEDLKENAVDLHNETVKIKDTVSEDASETRIQPLFVSDASKIAGDFFETDSITAREDIKEYARERYEEDPIILSERVTEDTRKEYVNGIISIRDNTRNNTSIFDARDSIAAKDDISESSDTVRNNPLNLQDRMIPTGAYQEEQDIIGMWDMIKNHKYDKISDIFRIKHAVKALINKRFDDNIHTSDMLKQLSGDLTKINELLSVASKTADHSIKDLSTSVCIQDEIICLEDALNN